MLAEIFIVSRKMRTDDAGKETYYFIKELPQNPNELIVDKLTAFETRLFQPFDLLFDDGIESSGPHEQ
jgi:hypothetical protein